MRVYSEEEVAASEGLLYINDAVVDVTEFAGVHPGGEALVRREVGRDATDAYNSVRHSPHADSIVQRLKVGTIHRNVLARLFTVSDVTREGRARLSPAAKLYYDAGADDGSSIAEAIAAWNHYWLVPRVLIDVSRADLSTTVLGATISLPLLSAPTALLKMAHPQGEVAVAKACSSAGIGNCLSTTASMPLEDVAEAAPEGYRWFQLYVYKDRGITERLVKRAAKAGYSAICLTVDLPVLGNRTELEKKNFSVPSEYKMANVVSEMKKKGAKPAVDVAAAGDRKAYVSKLYDQSLTPDLVAWVAGLTDLPLVVKGVLGAESAARIAAMPCVRGMVVSNHGGRQLNGTVPPAFALPGVVAAVKAANVVRAQQRLGSVEVYVDGGIRKGSDIFKAIALGARAVLIGRPIIYGLATQGEPGVRKTLDILRAELTNCMQLCGARTLAEITPDMVTQRLMPARM